MAQRAYRHRKESTISSLEKKVQELTEASEEMSNIFINLYDFAVGKGLLQREPEFGQHLQSATERFLALAKASVDEENEGDDVKNDGAELGRHSKGQKNSLKNSQKVHHVPESTVSKLSASEPSPFYGGYILSKDEDPEIDMTYRQEDQYRDNHYEGDHGRNRPSDIEIITRPTEDNASFPLDWMDLQQYRVEVPEIEDLSQTLFSQSQLPLPKSFAFNENSFSRRIQRVALERAFRIITSDDPSTEEDIKRIFCLPLLYRSKEAITARLRRLVDSTAKDSLQEWRAPFVHIGGAGTYYPMHESDANCELMPKFRTGYSMGPFSLPVTETQQHMDDNLKCSLPGFKGDFFDANDVEGYLRGRGVDIAPAADFVTVELDLLLLSEASSTKSSTNDSIVSIISPRTPESSVDPALLDAEKIPDAFDLDLVSPDSSLRDINPVIQTLRFPLGYADWNSDDSLKEDSDSVLPIFNTKLDQGAKSGVAQSGSNTRYNNKRTVTIDVNVLMNGTSPLVAY